MKSAQQFFFIHLISVFLIIGTIAVMWDGWWHLAIGREDFFIPPHLLLYSSVGLAVLTGFYGWIKFKQKVWRNIALLLLLIPGVAPFDNLWHAIFGVENFSSPLVVWSPPHLIGILSTILVLMVLFKYILQEKNVIAKRFFGGLILAAVLSFVYLLAAPLYPTGPYRLLGFWGAGIIAFFVIGLLLFAHKKLPGIGGAIDVSLYGIAMMVVGPLFGVNLARNVLIPTYGQSPNWVIAFAFFIPAILVDLLGKYPMWLRGAVAGGVYSLVLYGLNLQFSSSLFKFPFVNVLIATVVAIVGGFVAGLLLGRLKLR